MHISRNMYRTSHEGYYRYVIKSFCQKRHTTLPPPSRPASSSSSCPLNFLAVISRAELYKMYLGRDILYGTISYNYLSDTSLISSKM